MDKEQFRSLIIDPLEKKFDIKIYFNRDKEVCLKFYKPFSSYGVAYIYQIKKFIIIDWIRSDIYKMLRILFHELGHITLHGKGSNFRGRSAICELEAELTVYFVCRELNICYNYYLWDKTHKKTDLEILYQNKPKRSKPRYELIISKVKEIVKLLKPIIEDNMEFDQFIELENIKKLIYK